ncbi:hypothetical protein HaLaN_00183 [Haematococcus lacustris]|uniref:Uncharacterized protein n=1 Tax=Haematococcus lacustris TaxID=44745 RepID=A0A699YFD8_HAELA|nr:hypothetical protein HaLaN_00183 [Haematococcus lacustris]
MLQQLQVFCEYFANSNELTPCNQLQWRLGRPRQILHYSIKPALNDPSNQELLAKLQQLGSVNLTGDHNTISHHSMQLVVAMQQHYSNPGGERYVKLYAKAARARLGWSGVEAQLFIKLACGYALNADCSPELQASDLDKAHVNDLKEEAAKQRRLLALEEEDSLQDTAVSAASGVWDLAKGQLVADTEGWLAPVKPHLQHLAAASPAGTSLEANLKHITVTLAT